MVPRKGSQAVTRACITSATSLAYRGRNVCHPQRLNEKRPGGSEPAGAFALDTEQT